MEPLLTIADIQKLLQISKSQAYTLSRKIGCVKLGGALRFRQADIEKFINEKVEQSAPQQSRPPMVQPKKLRWL
jgi:predicted DNA-binding transcriptional regulator AlpA